MPGFGMAIRTPELMSSSSWFVNVMFNIIAIGWSRRGVEYFSSSGYIWSSPRALLFLSRLVVVDVFTKVTLTSVYRAQVGFILLVNILLYICNLKRYRSIF